MPLIRIRLFCLGALATLCLAICACGTYRGTGSAYRSGKGEFRTSSDYAESGESRDFYMSEARTAPTFVPSSEFKLYWPVTSVKMNRGFRPRTDPNHEGLDLGGPRGAPILAAHEGVVIYSGRDFRGYGNMVMIEYDPQWATLYAHLDKIFVKEGHLVKAGDPIGSMGKTGRASGVHLHFELIHQRVPIDPLPVIARGSRIAISKTRILKRHRE